MQPAAPKGAVPKNPLDSLSATVGLPSNFFPSLSSPFAIKPAATGASAPLPTLQTAPALPTINFESLSAAPALPPVISTTTTAATSIPATTTETADAPPPQPKIIPRALVQRQLDEWVKKLESSVEDANAAAHRVLLLEQQLNARAQQISAIRQMALSMRVSQLELDKTLNLTLEHENRLHASTNELSAQVAMFPSKSVDDANEERKRAYEKKKQNTREAEAEEKQRRRVEERSRRSRSKSDSSCSSHSFLKRFLLAREMSMKAEEMRTEISSVAQSLNRQLKSITDSEKEKSFREYESQVQEILNAHLNSLLWLDQNTELLSLRIDQIAKKTKSKTSSPTVSVTSSPEPKRNVGKAFV